MTFHSLLNIVSVTFCDFCADDATFHTHSDNTDTIEKCLQTDGNKAKHWGKGNKMHIHYVKTTCMIAGTKPKLQDKPQLNLKIDGHSIANVFKQKLLGLLIDNTISWTAHIDNLCSSLSSKISLLCQLAYYSVCLSRCFKEILSGLHTTANRLWVHHMVGNNWG